MRGYARPYRPYAGGFVTRTDDSRLATAENESPLGLLAYHADA